MHGRGEAHGSKPRCMAVTSPLAGEVAALRAAGEGTAPEARVGVRPPLPNPSPAGGEGLEADAGGSGAACAAVEKADDATGSASLSPLPLRERSPRCARRERGPRRRRAWACFPPLPNPSPARGEGLEADAGEVELRALRSRRQMTQQAAHGCHLSPCGRGRRAARGGRGDRAEGARGRALPLSPTPLPRGERGLRREIDPGEDGRGEVRPDEGKCGARRERDVA